MNDIAAFVYHPAKMCSRNKFVFHICCMSPTQESVTTARHRSVLPRCCVGYLHYDVQVFIPPSAFERIVCMFERIVYMFEGVVYMFERIVYMLERFVHIADGRLYILEDRPCIPVLGKIIYILKRFVYVFN